MNRLFKTLLFFTILSISSLYAATCTALPPLDGTDSSISITKDVDLSGKNKTEYYRFRTTVDGKLRMRIDKYGNQENVKFSDDKCDGNKIYQKNDSRNVDETFTITANKTYYIKIKEKNWNDKLKFKMTLDFTKTLPYGGEAENICYEESIKDGEKITTPINSLEDNLENVIIYFDTSSLFSIPFFDPGINDCSVDNGPKSQNCEEHEDGNTFGPVSIFNDGGWTFALGSVSTAQNRSISTYNDGDSFFDKIEDMFAKQGALKATYEKNGLLYTGAIKSCATTTPPEPEDEDIPIDTANSKAPICGVFEDALQTHNKCSDGSDILIKSATIIYNNNGDTELSTCTVTDNTLNWGLTTKSCDSDVCSASGAPSNSLTITYENRPAFDALTSTTTSSTKELSLPGTFTDYQVKSVDAPGRGGDSGTFNVTNSIHINDISLATNNTLKFKSDDDYNIEIGSFSSGHHLSLSTDTNAKNIKIKDLDAGSDHATIDLTASQTIKMSSFKFGNSSNVTLKAKYIQIDNFDFSNASNANLTIYADYLDIGQIKPNGSSSKIIIKPFTQDKRVLARFNNFYTGAESEYVFSSGNYYINDTMYLHGSGSGTKINLENSATSVNIYLNDEPDTGNNFILNANGLNGDYNSNRNATQFNIFVNGNFETGTGGTTINATVYAEKEIKLTSDARVKGAVSAGKKVTTDGNNVEVEYDQSVSQSGWASCGLTIGFDKEEYQTKEDYSLFDNFTSTLALNIVLSSPVAEDTTVTYATRDGSAIAGSNNDYIAKRDTATILAGETNTTIYIDIVHDVAIELDEYFYIDLSEITPSDGSITMGINPVKVTILAQTAQDLPMCYSDDFSGKLDNKWRTLRGIGYTPQVVDGRLRLTEGSGNIATAVTKDYEFASKHNMIVVEFEQYAYGGCIDTSKGVGSGLGDYGADGIVAVLYDSDVGAEPVPGGRGGSMGYAQINEGSTHQNGFQGGWLGLGIDEYGNYANGNEGRVGGIGFSTNYASIRGDGAGLNGYDFLAASEKLNGIADKHSSSPKYGYKYKMTTDARDPDHLYITLERDSGSGYQVIIDKFDAKDPKYNQSTTPEFVRFAFTSGTGGGCNRHEIDELSVRGYCQAYDPNPPLATQNKSDVIDTFVDDVTYNTGTKYITTKVSGKTESITAVHLDDAGRAAKFSSRDNLTFKVIPYLSDSVCSTRTILTDTTGNPAVLSVTSGNYAQSSNVVMPKKAMKDARFSMSALDFQEVYNASNQQCLKNAPTTGNMQGIGTCAATGQQYLLTFGQETYDRCYVNNGEPCKPSNNGQGSVPYDNEYGCLMCTLDTSKTCSNDNFAIRPEALDLSSSNSDFPNLLRSAESYKLNIKAYNHNSSKNASDTTSLYTIENAQNVLTFNTTLKAPDGTTDNSLHGTTTWDTSSSWDIVNGISTDGSITEVAALKFNDVGRVNIAIVDDTWADVDLSDARGMHDPSATAHNDCDSDGAYVCGDLNATFIPFNFTFVDTKIVNNDANPGSFTYISNLNPSDPSTFTMAARIETTIEARNKDGEITQNFKTSSYENPVFLSLVVNNTKMGLASSTQIGDGTEAGNKLLNFTDGSYTLPWNSSDNTKVLRFNFPRVANDALNPFKVTPAEVKLNISSIYKDNSNEVTIVDDNSADGTTVGNITQDATFIYGRTNAPRQRIEGNSGTAFIYYESYCSATDSKGNTCNKNLLPNGSSSTSINDPRWYINSSHNTNSGSVGTITQKRGSSLTIGTATGTNKMSVPLQYNDAASKGYPYKTTLENNASSWLIYNKYDAADTTNEFDVEFTNDEANWAGIHETDATTDTNATKKTNRRTMW